VIGLVTRANYCFAKTYGQLAKSAISCSFSFHIYIIYVRHAIAPPLQPTFSSLPVALCTICAERGSANVLQLHTADANSLAVYCAINPSITVTFSMR